MIVGTASPMTAHETVPFVDFCEVSTVDTSRQACRAHSVLSFSCIDSRQTVQRVACCADRETEDCGCGTDASVKSRDLESVHLTQQPTVNDSDVR